MRLLIWLFTNAVQFFFWMCCFLLFPCREDWFTQNLGDVLLFTAPCSPTAHFSILLIPTDGQTDDCS